MKNIFIINGGHPFAESHGKFNESLLNHSIAFFNALEDSNIKFTQIKEDYQAQEEVEKFKWADLVIYHLPIWWFQIPFGFKKYLDVVFTHGHQNGIYDSDGRSRQNPDINYGTAGLLKGKKYILTTSWNAPKAAFTLKNEFFEQKSVDEGVMFGFHKMNAFIGMELLATQHFYDIMRNADVPSELKSYTAFLTETMGRLCPVESNNAL